jgi:hypothetical protein
MDLMTSSLVWERTGETEESIPMDSFTHNHTGKKTSAPAHVLAEVRGNSGVARVVACVERESVCACARLCCVCVSSRGRVGAFLSRGTILEESNLLSFPTSLDSCGFPLWFP